MTPEEEAYAEALRRIREAEANGAVVLRPHLTPNTQPLRVQAAQRRLYPAGRPHLAPMARPLRVRAAQRLQGPDASSKTGEWAKKVNESLSPLSTYHFFMQTHFEIVEDRLLVRFRRGNFSRTPRHRELWLVKKCEARPNRGLVTVRSIARCWHHRLARYESGQRRIKFG